MVTEGVAAIAAVVGRVAAGSEDIKQLADLNSYWQSHKPFLTHPSHIGGREADLIKGVTMNIYVGNLSFETTEDELRKEFTKFGKVISVTIMNDKYMGSGQPRDYGYVEMASKSEGATAIANL
jgi:RNA recognition motif-containing protein